MTCVNAELLGSTAALLHELSWTEQRVFTETSSSSSSSSSSVVAAGAYIRAAAGFLLFLACWRKAQQAMKISVELKSPYYFFSFCFLSFLHFLSVTKRVMKATAKS